MASVMVEADVAVCQFGVTAYELATLGIPAIHLCSTVDHVDSSTAFGTAGMAITCGLATPVHALTQAMTTLLRDGALRKVMASRARRVLDAGGVGRIVDVITRAVRRRRVA
jgi:spore coat polysaccharide biosynthesis predicted glycosyltransferase SpsG